MNNPSWNNSTNIINNGESNIGLDLLVNSNKMLNSNEQETNKNHKEIDLMKQIEEESEPEIKEEKKKEDSNDSDDSDDSSDDDSSDNNNENVNYSYTAKEPEPSLEDIIEEKKNYYMNLKDLKKGVIIFLNNFH